MQTHYLKCHCEHSEAIPGPDLACMDVVIERQACAAEAISFSNHVAPPDPVPVSGRGGRAH
jgi:hypothetical protein